MSGVIIPKPFVYDSSFATFYTQIDDEHKVLFQSVFDVAAKPGDQGAVDRMYAVMNSHFANEEGIMQYANYVDFHKHKMQHDRFLARLQTITAPVGKDCIHFAKDWLVNHIKVTDFKYRGKL